MATAAQRRRGHPAARQVTCLSASRKAVLASSLVANAPLPPQPYTRVREVGSKASPCARERAHARAGESLCCLAGRQGQGQAGRTAKQRPASGQPALGNGGGGARSTGCAAGSRWAEGRAGSWPSCAVVPATAARPRSAGGRPPCPTRARRLAGRQADASSPSRTCTPATALSASRSSMAAPASTVSSACSGESAAQRGPAGREGAALLQCRGHSSAPHSACDRPPSVSPQAAGGGTLPANPAALCHMRLLHTARCTGAGWRPPCRAQRTAGSSRPCRTGSAAPTPRRAWWRRLRPRPAAAAGEGMGGVGLIQGLPHAGKARQRSSSVKGFREGVRCVKGNGTHAVIHLRLSAAGAHLDRLVAGLDGVEDVRSVLLQVEEQSHKFDPLGAVQSACSGQRGVAGLLTSAAGPHSARRTPGGRAPARPPQPGRQRRPGPLGLPCCHAGTGRPPPGPFPSPGSSAADTVKALA